ncbi:lysylphosphatidylglycerol synthase transmembrane domain-containing protein [Haloarchaeobius sp. HME9146]|uniref:lysylphosphatidylglycerol synthase transmembrane domain-containing protein n=1 Tax=Haloarchaeobius sp. HME9146 TaxID=2978732 RepID=UPI0021BF2A35|nr:flippase-like domain-containing protein [Haloarchaeobius sp. HME9146]
MTDQKGGSFAEMFGRQTLVKMGVGFVIALVLVYLLGTVVGWEETITEVREADPAWIALGCLSTLLCLMMWGRAWQIVLGVGGIKVPYHKLVVTYFAATFANYVTPLGQAGGEPFIAYVLSRDTDADYEQSLASVVTADLLNLLPFFNFAAVGVAYLVFQSSFQGSETVDNLVLGLGALAVGVPAIVWAGWRHRNGVEEAVVRIITPLSRLTSRISADGIRHRIERFYTAIERIAAEPRALARALGYAYLGWFFFTVPMYTAVRATGADMNAILVFFIVPASTIAGLVPTPGGLGAVEGALTVLLSQVGGLSQSSGLAVATLYRVESYLFALLVGGIAALWVTIRA